MLLRVKYTNGKYDMVKPALLDVLLETSKVVGFRRSNGWAVVEHDRIRNRIGIADYIGPDRRAA